LPVQPAVEIESLRLLCSSVRSVSNGMHRELRLKQIQLRSTSGILSHGPAAIDVAQSTCV
jgi:hypothetical protein